MVARKGRICVRRVEDTSFLPRHRLKSKESALPGAFDHARDDDAYSAFARIDGRHPFRDPVPGGRVDYRARRRRDGEVAFFNYGLAREMGLIPAPHPDTMSAALPRAPPDAFALVIVNEYDVAHAVRIPPRDLLPHPYMATRYLQL